ncbi:MAG: hypothetical protein IH940_13650 [Acidobacteria bacterium]|nr:hypothetical protein [Acidobacteriota bacterium]
MNAASRGLLTDAVDAYNDVFLVGFGVLVLTAFVGLFLPGREKALELQEERRVELEEIANADVGASEDAAIV